MRRLCGPTPRSSTSISVQVLPSTPSQGFVEFDAAEIAKAVLEVSIAGARRRRECRRGGNQQPTSVDGCLGPRRRASLSGPGSGGRTCEQWGTAWLCRHRGSTSPRTRARPSWRCCLDIADPDRSRDLCAGTVDSWVAWTLSQGSLHVSDRSNLAVTGLLDGNAAEWDEAVLEALRIPHARTSRGRWTPSGVLGEASSVAGSTADRRAGR